jgi:hypothetical protein
LTDEIYVLLSTFTSLRSIVRSKMNPLPSTSTVIRMNESYEANLIWFRTEGRGPRFAQGFLHGCSNFRKLLFWFGKEDWELAAAKVVAKEG